MSKDIENLTTYLKNNPILLQEVKNYVNDVKLKA